MLIQLASRLQGRGFQQHVVSLRGHGLRAEDLEKLGIPVTCVHMSSPVRAIGELLKIIALVRRLRPNVIQGWMYHGDIVASLAHRLAPCRSQRRLFWGIRASNMDERRYRQAVRWSARLSRWPDVVIANSSAGARFHLEKGYRPRRLEVIPNGIDVDKFRPDPELREKMRAELGIPADACVAIHIARVDPMKDHATCVAALTQVPDVVGLLVGLDTETLTLPPNVRGLGRRTDVMALYAASDIVLSTSAYGEGFSNAIAEGMATGLVPVATDVGDTRTIVGDTGTVIAPGDVATLANELRRAAQWPPGYRQQCGLAARDRIVRLYSLERAVDSYVRLYSETPLAGGAPADALGRP